MRIAVQTVREVVSLVSLASLACWAGACVTGCGSGAEGVGRPEITGVQCVGGPEDQQAHAVALASDDSAVVVGGFSGVARFMTRAGIEDRTSAGSFDLFVGRFRAGDADWVVTTGGRRYDEARAVAIGPGGDLVVAGGHGDQVDFDPGPDEDLHTRAGPESEAFVWGLTAEGAFRFVEVFPGIIDPDSSFATSLAIAPDGTIWAAGLVRGTLTLGVGSNRYVRTELGGTGGFVIDVGRGGKVGQALMMDGPDDDSAVVTMTSAGVLHLAGDFTGPLDLGPPGAPDVRKPDGLVSGFLILGVGTDRRVVRTLGGPDALVVVRDVAPTAAGGALVAGEFTGRADLDPAPAEDWHRSDGADGFIVAVGPDGGRRWVAVLGGAGDQSVADVVATGEGGALATGRGVLLARLDDTGMRRWTVQPTAGAAEGRALSARGPNVVVVGTFTGTTTFGASAATTCNAEARDAFILRARAP